LNRRSALLELCSFQLTAMRESFLRMTSGLTTSKNHVKAKEERSPGEKKRTWQMAAGRRKKRAGGNDL